MDKIIIKGLKLFAYHGVNPESLVGCLLWGRTESDMTEVT